MSELFRGAATLELVDMSKVTGTGAGLAISAEDRPKVAEATAHFRAAEEALTRASEICASFRAKSAKPEVSAFLDCDPEGFKRLRELVARVAVPRGDLPALEDLQAVVSAIDGQVEAWRKNAAALRGSPGHYPAPPAKPAPPPRPTGQP